MTRWEKDEGQFRRRKCNGKTMKKEKCSGNCTHSTRIAWQSRRLSARDSRKENLNSGRRKTISSKRDKDWEDGLRHPSVRHNCSAKEKKARTQTSRKPDLISLLSHPSRLSVRFFSNFEVEVSSIVLFLTLLSSWETIPDTNRHRHSQNGRQRRRGIANLHHSYSFRSKQWKLQGQYVLLSLSFLSNLRIFLSRSYPKFSLDSWIYSFRPFLSNPFPFSAQKAHDNLYHSRHIHLHASHITHIHHKTPTRELFKGSIFLHQWIIIRFPLWRCPQLISPIVSSCRQ